jgi:apolipoprotein D and lipocalin family protein
MESNVKRSRVLFAGFLAALLAACAGVPKGLSPVEDFDIDRYTGKWYEIARLDHPFERGLTRVTAEYTQTEAGGIRVINRGYDPVEQEWRQIEGRAVFTGSERTGSLKVSFFGPFYGGYHIIALDCENYRYALVAGATRSYLWILARTPRLDPAVVTRLVEEAERLGFDTDSLIFVDHGPVED